MKKSDLSNSLLQSFLVIALSCCCAATVLAAPQVNERVYEENVLTDEELEEAEVILE